jgi:hypothetical protein
MHTYIYDLLLKNKAEGGDVKKVQTHTHTHTYIHTYIYDSLFKNKAEGGDVKKVFRLCASLFLTYKHSVYLIILD